MIASETRKDFILYFNIAVPSSSRTLFHFGEDDFASVYARRLVIQYFPVF